MPITDDHGLRDGGILGCILVDRIASPFIAPFGYVNREREKIKEEPIISPKVAVEKIRALHAFSTFSNISQGVCHLVPFLLIYSTTGMTSHTS